MFNCVYILQDQKGKFYIGSTTNLKRRLREHISGQTKTTNNMDNPCLVFSSMCKTISEARIIEKRLKNLKRKDYIEKIIKDGYIKMQ